MVRATLDGPSAGGAANRSASSRDLRAVGLAALGFLPLLACFFATILWLVLAQPDMPFALIGFVAAFASIGAAIAWVGLVLTRARRRSNPTHGGAVRPSIKD